MTKTSNKTVFESALSDLDGSMCVLCALEELAKKSASTNLNQICVRYAMKALAGEAVQNWKSAALKCEIAWRASKKKDIALAKACDGLENALDVFKTLIDDIMCEDIGGDEFSRSQKEVDCAVTIGLMHSAVHSLNNAVSAIGGSNTYSFEGYRAPRQAEVSHG